MKQSIICLLITLSCSLFAQTDNLPFIVGEYSSFKISFGPINAGFATLKVQEIVEKNTIPCYHIIGKGRTASFFDWFFKVRDVYETFIDTSKLVPINFIRNIHEGGYSKKQHYMFNHKDNIVYTQDTSYSIPSNAQDMLSALFYARTFNKNDLKQSQSFFVPIFMDEENYNLEIMYLKNELVETKFGIIDCMVFNPKMQEGRVFEDEEEMKIWISDDKNHLLIRVEAKIWSGTIKADIVSVDHLKTSLTIINQ